jgi:hypothetical protein
LDAISNDIQGDRSGWPSIVGSTVSGGIVRRKTSRSADATPATPVTASLRLSASGISAVC